MRPRRFFLVFAIGSALAGLVGARASYAAGTGAASIDAPPEDAPPADASAPDGVGEMVDFSPHFVVGEPVRYEHVLTMTQKRKYGEFAEGVISLQMVSNLRFLATRLLPGGGAEVELTFDRLSIDIVPSKAPRVQFDTETDTGGREGTPFIRALRRVSHTPIIYELDAAGQVTSLVGADEIERLVEGLKGYELIAGVFNEAWLRELAEDAFGPAGPEPRRRVGASWESELALQLGGYPGARTTVRWTVRPASDDEVVIEGEGKMTPPVRVDPRLTGLEQRVDGTFSRFGVVWDPVHGRVISVEKGGAMNLIHTVADRTLSTTSLGTHTLLRFVDQ